MRPLLAFSLRQGQQLHPRIWMIACGLARNDTGYCYLPYPAQVQSAWECNIESVHPRADPSRDLHPLALPVEPIERDPGLVKVFRQTGALWQKANCTEHFRGQCFLRFRLLSAKSLQNIKIVDQYLLVGQTEHAFECVKADIVK